MKQRAAIILAAGMGTRMKSSLPKVLHPVGGRPVIDWSIALAKSLGCDPIICVVSPDVEAVRVQQLLNNHRLLVQATLSCAPRQLWRASMEMLLCFMPTAR